MQSFKTLGNIRKNFKMTSMIHHEEQRADCKINCVGRLSVTESKSGFLSSDSFFSLFDELYEKINR